MFKEFTDGDWRRRVEMLLLTTWFGFVIRYRKTFVGPVWTVIGPALFIIVLGGLYSQINSAQVGKFVPHLAIGLVVWTFINSLISNGASAYTAKRGQILQGGMSLTDIAFVGVLSELLLLLHQLIIIIAVIFFFSLPVNLYTFVSLLGLCIIVINGVWITVFFGIIGSRYRDLREMTVAIMRIAFLATPILWLPEQRGGMTNIFWDYNPFYHFLEIVRAPILGNDIALLSWIVVIAITCIGFVAAHFAHRRYGQYVVLWV